MSARNLTNDPAHQGTWNLLLLCALLACLVGACQDGSAPSATGNGQEVHDDHDDDDDHDDHDDADEHEVHVEGEPIELSPEQASAAGIVLHTAGPGLVEKRLVLPAVVEPDTNAISHVTASISGVVSVVNLGLGQQVEEGDILCVLDSVELGGIAADYRRDKALAAAATKALEGEKKFFKDRLAGALANFDGTIEVRRATVEQEQKLHDQQLSTLRPLLEAERALQEAELAKSLGMTELEAERDGRLLALESASEQSRITALSSYGRITALGIHADDLKAILDDSGVYAGSFSIRARRSGVIIKRLLSVGQYVPMGTELFEIQDLSKIWVVASAFEGSLRKITRGQRAEVRLHAFPGTVLVGEVVKINDSVDRESRALALRVELENKTLEAWDEQFPLRPGMFGEVSLVIESKQVPIALPEAAIVHEASGIDAVFVQVEDGHFEKRIVEVLIGDAELVEVRPVPGAGEPLKTGDRVAVGGTFTLKSMDQSENLVGHEH